MSHSHVLEWISGSFIQSHWPWLTLWPISMFSTLFAKASDTVPKTQPARDRLHADEQARRDLEHPLEPDGAPDVGGVPFTERLLDVAPNGVQFVPEGLDVRLRQMRVRSDVGNCQWMSCRSGPGRDGGLL